MLLRTAVKSLPAAFYAFAAGLLSLKMADAHTATLSDYLWFGSLSHFWFHGCKRVQLAQHCSIAIFRMSSDL